MIVDPGPEPRPFDVDAGAAAPETALIVEAPDAEALVGAVRAELDPSAARGMPAHLTILYPFAPDEGLTAAVVAALAGIARGTKAFSYRLTTTGEFDAALWLRPSPDDPFRGLVETAWARFPECPPYRGAHARIVPHLTVAVGPVDERDARWRAARRELDRRLPWPCTATALSIWRTDDSGCWRRGERLTFAR